MKYHCSLNRTSPIFNAPWRSPNESSGVLVPAKTCTDISLCTSFADTETPVPAVKFGSGNVMVWEAMSYRGTGRLCSIDGSLNARGYIWILEDSAVPSAHLLGHGDHFSFQDDGVSCQRANSVKERKSDIAFQCLD